MKQYKIWTLLSLLIFWGIVGCNVDNAPNLNPNGHQNNNSAEGNENAAEATSLPKTAVPTPPAEDPEENRSVRLTPAATPQVDKIPSPAGTAVVGEVPKAIMTAVYENLITQQNVTAETITVIRAEATIWQDGSLGCPEPGQVYTQAAVNGYWIVLEANGRSYDYRAAENGYIHHCQSGLPAPPAAGTPTS